MTLLILSLREAIWKRRLGPVTQRSRPPAAFRQTDDPCSINPQLVWLLLIERLVGFETCSDPFSPARYLMSVAAVVAQPGLRQLAASYLHLWVL